MISHDVKMKDSLKKTSFKLLAVLLLAPPAARCRLFQVWPWLLTTH